jgi:glycosyltransferase involved in cell wall biosynthesis
MFSTPTVSVIIPTYNRMKFLPETVDTILKQTMSDFELIIINDNSSDETDEWIKSQTDARIKYILLTENRGPSYARNRGLDIAQGKYIAFADDDDINILTRFAEQVAEFEADEKLAVCGSYMEFFGKQNFIEKFSTRYLPYRVKALYKIPFYFPATMVRRSFIEKEEIRFRPEIRSADDYYFLMKIVAKGKSKILPKVLYRYRAHASSITGASYKNQTNNAKKITQLAFQEILNLNLSDEETALLYRFRRFKCKPKEKQEVETLYQKLMAFAEKTPNFNKHERKSFIDSLIHRKLVFEKKKVQLAFFLLWNEIRILFTPTNP